ncbi:hypothetical protein Tco_0638182 [Tanacetum coccineum]
MHREQAQQVARDEKLVPTKDKVKIVSNLRMDPTITQKEETYQVILDIIKNTPCYNAFPFLLMCLKSTCSNSGSPSIRLRNLLSTNLTLITRRGIYHKANVDYAALIWEDLQYQIDNRQSKTFIALSIGLIPPKKGRGKGTQGTKAMIITKKATAASKKKRAKKIKSSDEESEEQEERLIRKTKGVVIQDTPQVSNKKSINQYQKLKGIKLLSSKRESRFQHQSSGSSEGARITPEVLDELTGKSIVSDKGAGTSLEVPDETKDKSETQDDQDDWGFIDDETFLFDDKDEKAEDIPWVSTNEDEYDNDDKENDDIKTDLAKEHKKSAKKIDEQKADEELKADEEQQEDDQVGDKQVEVPVSTTHIEKLNLLQSTSSHSVSSNFGNKFNNSSNVSLIAIVIPSAPIPNPEAFNDVIQRVSELEKDVKELKQVDHFTAILESIKSETTPYDKAAKDEHKQKDILFRMMMASMSHIKHHAHKKLYDVLIQSLLMDKNDMDRLVMDPASQTKRRHNDKDQDPPTGSDQGMKKRRMGKDVEPLKKSSKTKESAKGKTPSNTSKSGKSVFARKSVYKPEHVVQMDVEEPNLDNVANDFDEPQVDANLNIPNKDWFKKSPRLETLDPDWNTVKTIDDASE